MDQENSRKNGHNFYKLDEESMGTVRANLTEGYNVLVVRHIEKVMQLLQAFNEDQIDFALEMEVYETERVEAEKEQDIENASETILCPNSESDEQSSHLLLDAEITEQRPTEEILEMTLQLSRPTTPPEPQPHEPLPENVQEEQALEPDPTPTPNPQHEPDSTPTKPSILHIFYDA